MIKGCLRLFRQIVNTVCVTVLLGIYATKSSKCLLKFVNINWYFNFLKLVFWKLCTWKLVQKCSSHCRFILRLWYSNFSFLEQMGTYTYRQYRKKFKQKLIFKNVKKIIQTYSHPSKTFNSKQKMLFTYFYLMSSPIDINNFVKKKHIFKN